MKRKIIFFISASLDGYIADTDGGVDFLSQFEKTATKDSEKDYNDFYESIDTVIMGSTTYKQIITTLSPDVWPYIGRKTYVYSSRPLTTAYHGSQDIVFTNTPPAQLVELLKSREGNNIWLLGGAKLANCFIKNNLVDEYQIYLVPLILGEGIRLFSSDITTQLKLTSVSNIDGLAKLVYKNLTS